MEKIVSKISQLGQHIDSLIGKRIESLLEDKYDPGHKEKQKSKENFEVSRDLSLVRGLSAGLPNDHIDKIVVLFSRLAMCFEAGVMLENEDGKWKAQAVFERGVIETLHEEKRPSISLPQVKLLSILKTDSQSLLKKLSLSQLDSENEMTCLLIKVSGDFSFVLLSKLPDLWLKDHVENIRQALQSGIAD